MPEWIYEDGIGEARAALVSGGSIIEVLIQRDDGGPRAGAVIAARMGAALPDTGRALAALADGTTVILRVPQKRPSEGAAIRIAITREAIPDAGDPKPAQGRLAEPDEAPGDGPSLVERIAATGDPITTLLPHQPDRLEQAGWSEVMEEARSGLIPFPSGLLRISLTPAMTLIDVDGGARNSALAIAGAAAAGAAIRRLALAGSIGIDLPTLASKTDRQKAAAVIDAALPQPFERTAVNGFGFIQVVRRRLRPSLPELIRADPAGASALALLRRAERADPSGGGRTLIAAPPVIARLEARADWLDALARRVGGAIALRAEPGLAISAGDVRTSPR